MLFYVKDRKTFSTKCVLEGVSWKLVQSVWTDLSEIVAKDDPNVASGDFVYNEDGWIALISDLERDDNKISLKLEKIENLFDRKIAWSGFGTIWNCEHTCYYMMNTFYVPGTGVDGGTGDSMYALPYLNPTRLTNEAGASYPVLDNGLLSGKSYISQIRRLQDVYVHFKVNGSSLDMTIGHENRTQKTLVTTNVPCVIKEESFSDYKVAKITSLVYTDGNPPDFTDILDHYLMADGTVEYVPGPGQVRAEGEWKILEVQLEDDVTTVVRNEFAKNSYSHKVIVQLREEDARYDFYDPVRVEVNNHVYDSYVSRKTITSDGFVEYTFGDLKTSLTDKINEYD